MARHEIQKNPDMTDRYTSDLTGKDGVSKKTKLLIAVVFLVEALDTTSGIDHLLLAGEERMTLRADFNSVVTKRGAGFNDVAACTGDLGGFIIGMNAFFHDRTSWKSI